MVKYALGTAGPYSSYNSENMLTQHPAEKSKLLNSNPGRAAFLPSDDCVNSHGVFSFQHHPSPEDKSE